MDILNELYSKNVNENERNVRFWNEYLQNLKSLDFTTHNDKLKVPVLVPIGNRIFFRGELKHTNEVIVALGADYFVKCSSKQADVIRQHRIKGAQENVDIYSKERKYLQNQMSFTKRNIYNYANQEIIEHCTQEEDTKWREIHRANVRTYRQTKPKAEREQFQEKIISDIDLWNRLEELELQEELLNEFSSDDVTKSIKQNKETSLDTNDLNNHGKDITYSDDYKVEYVKSTTTRNCKKVKFANDIHMQTSPLDLHQVLDKTNELEEKIFEINNEPKNETKTASDIIANLDKLDKLDELEDEINRLEYNIPPEYKNDTDSYAGVASSIMLSINYQKKVGFIDDYDGKTLNITFKHSDIEPCSKPYDPYEGIQKPSDIYEAYPEYFKKKITSILKKPSDTLPLPGGVAMEPNMPNQNEYSQCSSPNYVALVKKDEEEDQERNEAKTTNIEDKVLITTPKPNELAVPDNSTTPSNQTKDVKKNTAEAKETQTANVTIILNDCETDTFKKILNNNTLQTTITEVVQNNNFMTETMPIKFKNKMLLKEENEIIEPKTKHVQSIKQSAVHKLDEDSKQKNIIVGDIAEKVDQTGIRLQTESRPMSLFKQKRNQKKSK